jgi:hypothetical protein
LLPEGIISSNEPTTFRSTPTNSAFAYPSILSKVCKLYKACWEHTRRSTFIYGTPLPIKKPYKDESEFGSEISVPKGKNLQNYVSFI